MKKQLLPILMGIGIFATIATIVVACRKNLNPPESVYAPYIVNKETILNMAKYVTKERYLKGRGRGTKITSGAPDSNLVRLTRTVKDYYVIKDHDSIPALYVINYEANGLNDGFVVISADYRYEPICAFVDKGGLHPGDTVPSMLGNWFYRTIEDIELLRDGLYDNNLAASFEWGYWAEELTPFVVLTPIQASPEWIDSCSPSFYHQKGPLLGDVAWGQGCSYNEGIQNVFNCSNCNVYPKTGCAATAVAMVMRYWAIPTSFNYNFASMPNTYGNTEVQRLMSDVGSSLNMNYGCGGSALNVTNNSVIASRLINPYGFSATHSNFNSNQTSDWNTLLNNLNANQPVILTGCPQQGQFLWFKWGNGICHVWVCDGYVKSGNGCYSSTDLHMNWGWNELNTSNNYIGYYYWNNWGVYGNYYQYANEIIYNIHP